MTADADILIARSQLTSQQHMLRYQEHIPIENLLRTICNYKQAYTQFGGNRLDLLFRAPFELWQYTDVFDTVGCGKRGVLNLSPPSPYVIRPATIWRFLLVCGLGQGRTRKLNVAFSCCLSFVCCCALPLSFEVNLFFFPAALRLPVVR